MNFAESVNYLYSLGNEVAAMKLGLEATEKLLAALENPQRNFLKIQVAGTNGKGSTCAFLDAICRAADIKTGLFTSPHLISITERIKINGAEISEEKFAEHATRVREIAENLVAQNELENIPTFFEQMTVIAVSAFGEAKIKIGILETGLGGRFDSVTATRAEIAAITPIDFDHQQILGNTLAEIAAEKVAIIRKDSKVVIAIEQHPEAMSVITQKCDSVDVTPHFSNYRTELLAVDTINGRMVAVFFGDELYHDVWLGLSGRHQLSNARIAISVAEILRKDFGFNIDKFNIEDGLENARHQGRLEFYKGILFDGAHNIAGAESLKNYLEEFIKQPVTMIFGAMRDKDLSEIGEILFPKADKLIFTKPDNPRSVDTADLVKFLPENFDENKVIETQTVADALKTAVEIAGAEDLTCVTGSLYLVGEARNLLNNK